MGKVTPQTITGVATELASSGHSPRARRMRPALTTVRQDSTAKGRLAVRTLLRRLEAGDDLPVAHHVLPTELVERDSTGPVPA